MATIEVELVPFSVPAAINVKLPSTGRREDGIGTPTTLALHKIPEETLRTMCEEFTNSVMELRAFQLEGGIPPTRR